MCAPIIVATLWIDLLPHPISAWTLSAGLSLEHLRQLAVIHCTAMAKIFSYQHGESGQAPLPHFRPNDILAVHSQLLR